MKALLILCVAAASALAQIKGVPLADLIQAGKLDAARASLAAGADVNAAQPDGSRPIHWAVYRVDYALVESLIAKKADLNVANAFGNMPIAEAAKLGDTKLVKMLLDGGAKPEGATPDGETALMTAIKLGHLPVVEMLVKAGANVNAVEQLQKQTALMWAVTAPKHAEEMTKLLLSKGANTKPMSLFSDWESQVTSEPRAQYRPVGGLTALLYAARDGCYRCTEALIAAGANVNVPTPEAVTPLMIALDNDHLEIAKLLLERGANPHLWDWWGRTALYIAIDQKVAAEVGRGDVSGNIRRSPPLAPPPAGVAAVSRMQMIEALLAKDVNVDAQVNFHRPSRIGNNGRFIEPLFSTGCTPLLQATIAKDIPLMKALLAKGASPNINGMGVTAFLNAAGVGTGVRFDPIHAPNMESVKLLVEFGADVNAQVTNTGSYSQRIARAPATNEGMSALHVAVQRGEVELVTFLLSHGINAELRDAQGKKAIDLLPAEAPLKKLQTAAEAGVSGPVAVRAPDAEEIVQIRALFANANPSR